MSHGFVLLTMLGASTQYAVWNEYFLGLQYKHGRILPIAALHAGVQDPIGNKDIAGP